MNQGRIGGVDGGKPGGDVHLDSVKKPSVLGGHQVEVGSRKVDDLSASKFFCFAHGVASVMSNIYNRLTGLFKSNPEDAFEKGLGKMEKTEDEKDLLLQKGSALRSVAIDLKSSLSAKIGMGAKLSALDKCFEKLGTYVWGHVADVSDSDDESWRSSVDSNEVALEDLEFDDIELTGKKEATSNMLRAVLMDELLEDPLCLQMEDLYSQMTVAQFQVLFSEHAYMERFGTREGYPEVFGDTMSALDQKANYSNNGRDEVLGDTFKELPVFKAYAKDEKGVPRPQGGQLLKALSSDQVLNAVNLPKDDKAILARVLARAKGEEIVEEGDLILEDVELGEGSYHIDPETQKVLDDTKDAFSLDDDHDDWYGKWQ